MRIAIIALLIASAAFGEPVAELSDALAKVAPVQGLSIRDWDDKSTWRIDFAPGVTSDQIAAAQAFVDGVDQTKFRKSPLRRRLYEARMLLDAMNAELSDPANADSAVDIRADRDAQAAVVQSLRDQLAR